MSHFLREWSHYESSTKLSTCYCEFHLTHLLFSQIKRQPRLAPVNHTHPRVHSLSIKSNPTTATPSNPSLFLKNPKRIKNTETVFLAPPLPYHLHIILLPFFHVFLVFKPFQCPIYAYTLLVMIASIRRQPESRSSWLPHILSVPSIEIQSLQASRANPQIPTLPLPANIVFF